MKVRSATKRVGVVTLALGLAFAGSVAFAYWTATGTGNGYATAATSSELTTTATAAVADLFPGADGDLAVEIENPNLFPVLVTDVARTADPITSDAGALCDGATGVSMTDQSGLSLAVPAGGSATFELADAVSMSNASADACQGAVFTIPLTITGRSDA